MKGIQIQCGSFHQKQIGNAIIAKVDNTSQNYNQTAQLCSVKIAVTNKHPMANEMKQTSTKCAQPCWGGNN